MSKATLRAWAVVNKGGRICDEMKWAGVMCIFRSRVNAEGAVWKNGEHVVQIEIRAPYHASKRKWKRRE